MNNYLTQNLKVIEDRHPELLKKITPFLETNKVEVCQSPDGLYDLIIPYKDGKIFLYGGKIQDQWIKGPLRSVNKDFYGICIFLGFGLGYSVESIIKNLPDVYKILIFEPSPDIFVTALKIRDLSPILSNPKVEIYLGIEEEKIKERIVKYERLLMNEDTYFLEIPSYKKFLPRSQSFFQKIFSFINELNISGATTAKQGETIFLNKIKNLDVLFRSHHLFDLKDIFKGIPAILVAAGPSLDKNIEFLKEVEDKAVIFCVDTSFATLKKYNITPHFISTIDYQEIAYQKISDWSSSDEINTNLLYILSCCPLVTKRFPAKRHIYCPISEMFNNLVNKLLFTKDESIECPSTVAHLNLLVAQIMGNSPIIFIGQDLTDIKSSHCKDTILQYNPKNKKGELIPTKAWGGGSTFTRRDFWDMKFKFEQYIQNLPETIYINATEGGVHIEGTTDIPLKEVIKRYLKDKHNINQRLLNIKQTTYDNKSRTINKLNDILTNCQKLKQLSYKGLNLTKKLQKTGNIVNNSLIEQTNKLIAKIEKDKVTYLIYELIAKYTKEIDRLKINIKNPADEFELFNKIFTYYRNAFSKLETELNKTLTNIKRELKIREKIRKNPEDKKLFIKLARVFYKLESFQLTRSFYLLSNDDNYRLFNETDILYFGKTLIHLHDIERFNLFIKEVPINSSIMEEFNILKRRYIELYLYKYLHWQHGHFNKKVLPQVKRHFLLKALKLDPQNKEVLTALTTVLNEDLDKAKQELANNNLIEAEKILNSWIKIFPDNLTVITLLSKTKLAQGDIISAVGLLERCLKLDPDNPENYIISASIFIQTNDLEQAKLAIEKACMLDPSYNSYWMELGDILFENNMINEALSAYEKAFINLPNKLELLIKISKCYLKLGQFKAAREALYQAIQISPNNQLIVEKLKILENQLNQ